MARENYRDCLRSPMRHAFQGRPCRPLVACAFAASSQSDFQKHGRQGLFDLRPSPTAAVTLTVALPDLEAQAPGDDYRQPRSEQFEHAYQP